MDLGIDLSLYLKLLLLPSLGLVVLCAFLLDDCYHQHSHHPHHTQHGRAHSHSHLEARGHRLHGGGHADLTAMQRMRRRLQRVVSRITKCVLIFSAVHRVATSVTSATRTRSTSSASASSSSSSSSTTSSASPHSSPSSSPFPSSDPIRLNLVSSDAIASCYRVSPSLPLRDVAAYYLRRLSEKAKASAVDGKGSDGSTSASLDTSIVKKSSARTVLLSSSVSGLAVEAVLLRYQGRRLSLCETVEQLGLPDMAVIEVEPDYLFAFTSIRRACDAVRSQSDRELSIEQQAKEEAEQANAERVHSCQQARDSITSMKRKRTDMQAERSSISDRIAALKQSIAGETEGETEIHTQSLHQHQPSTEWQARARVESSMENVDSGESELRAERLQLASEVELSKASSSTLSAEVEDLRVEYAAAVKDRNDGKDKQREMTSQLEVAEKEMAVWKQRAHRMQVNEQKIDKMEKAIAATAHYHERIQANNDEIQQIDADITLLLATRSVRDDKDKELTTLKQRIKQHDKDTRELTKYKQTVKLLEKEATEAARYKTLLKQGKVREKTLEAQLKELHHWRQRARAFEKEVKVLRGWKRALAEQWIRDGKGELLPAFPLEGGLDSGSDGLLSSGGSGMGDSSGSMTGGSGGLMMSGQSNDGTAPGARFFDSIRTGATSSPMAGHSVADYGDFGYPSYGGLDNEYVQQQQMHPSEYSMADMADEDMDLNSMIAASQQHHHGHTLLYGDSDQLLSSGSLSRDEAHFDLDTETPYSGDIEDDSELLQAGSSDIKEIKEAMARAAAYPPTSFVPTSSSTATASTFASPSKLRTLPTFYPSNSSAPFNPSIVYDDAPQQHPHTHSHHQQSAVSPTPLPPLHPSSLSAFPPHSAFFSSWPAQSSASPLLIIDDRLQTSNSTASTSSLSSPASAASSAHLFSLSSPSPFDHSALGGGKDEVDDGSAPAAAHRSRSQPLALTAQQSSLLHSALPPGLTLDSRFNSPLVIIDDQKGEHKDVAAGISSSK